MPKQVVTQRLELLHEFAAAVIPVAGERGHAVGETGVTHGIR
ncbi:hypothetical protein [Cryobacterium aureum]|nr:hypothetical protein [Cryobacterium aureum]